MKTVIRFAWPCRTMNGLSSVQRRPGVDAAACGAGRCSNRKASAGFTLIELMIVVTILAILAAMVVPKLMSRPDEARIVAARQDISTIKQALNLYRLDNKAYPSTEQGLQALVQKPTSGVIPDNWKSGGYLERLMNDPWGAPYQYLNPGRHGEIDVYSLGADRAPGGEGVNADIGSWEI